MSTLLPNIGCRDLALACAFDRTVSGCGRSYIIDVLARLSYAFHWHVDRPRLRIEVLQTRRYMIALNRIHHKATSYARGITCLRT